MIENWGAAVCLWPSKQSSSKGLSAFWRIFWMGNLQVTFSVLWAPLLSPRQLLKGWLLFPDHWMCLSWVPAPVSQLLLEGHFEVWSIFSASLAESTKASKKTRRFAKAYRVRGSPQNHCCPCRNSKLGNCSLVVLRSRVVGFYPENEEQHQEPFLHG